MLGMLKSGMLMITSISFLAFGVTPGQSQVVVKPYVKPSTIRAQPNLGTPFEPLPKQVQKNPTQQAIDDFKAAAGIKIESAPSRDATAIQTRDIQLLCDGSKTDVQRDQASERLRHAMKKTLRHLRASTAEHDEMINHTLMKVLMRCDDITAKDNPGNYVYVILKNINVDGAKQRKTVSAAQVNIDEQADLVVAPDDCAATVDAINQYNRLDKSLTDREREVLRMLLLGLETSEISGILGLGQDRVRDIRQQIRAKYAKIE